jgi:hypothetical protein
MDEDDTAAVRGSFLGIEFDPGTRFCILGFAPTHEPMTPMLPLGLCLRSSQSQAGPLHGSF